MNVHDPLPPAPSEIPIRADTDAQVAAYEAKRFAALLGMDEKAQWEVSIAAAELATNAKKHGIEGIVLLRFSPRPKRAFILEVIDCGPGLIDLERNLTDGVSSGVSVVGVPRQPGMGLGIGLGTVVRMMDEVEVDVIPNQGTRVIAKKFIVRNDAPDDDEPPSTRREGRR